MHSGNTYSTILWLFLWGIGGIWATQGAFRLRKNEVLPVGLAVGWVIDTLLVNMTSRVLAFPSAVWISAAMVFFLGLVITFRKDGWQGLKFPVTLSQIILLAGLSYAFIRIARGLALFDDYAHMPTLSIMATGELPPRFALDPNIPYSYHYFMLLFSAQLVRLAGCFPWVALDIARGASLALAIVLSGVWVRRLTFSAVAGFLGGLYALFNTGTRWLLLFLPESIQLNISRQINLIGSGASTAPNLYEALISKWGIDGMGPIAFPFAFINGITNPAILSLGAANGAAGAAITFPLLLSFNRWRGWAGGLVSILLLTSSGLLTEISLVFSLASWGMLALAEMIRSRKIKLPETFIRWLIVIIVGGLLSILQGGAWTEILFNTVNGTAGSEPTSYQTIGFQLIFPPTIVSSHLGVMNLTQPYSLLAAMAEIGPVLLALPLVIIWGWKAFKRQRWYETAMILAGLISFVMIFVQFTGSTGVRNTSRLYAFLGPLNLFAVPLIWRWVQFRSPSIKIGAAVLGCISIFGGLMVFGAATSAAVQPTLASMIAKVDLPIMVRQWDRLPKEALVFDTDPYRAPTLFGRHINSSITWFENKPEYEELKKTPLPADLINAGYAFAYFDEETWQNLPMKIRSAYENPCIKLLDQSQVGNHFRYLYDLSGCINGGAQ